jgi:hypothetical protein
VARRAATSRSATSTVLEPVVSASQVDQHAGGEPTVAAPFDRLGEQPVQARGRDESDRAAAGDGVGAVEPDHRGPSGVGAGGAVAELAEQTGEPVDVGAVLGGRGRAKVDVAVGRDDRAGLEVVDGALQRERHGR